MTRGVRFAVNQHSRYKDLESLDTCDPIWGRFFTVAPLVLVGTLEEDGSADFAPKHMAFPLGWSNHFGFVCTPRHGTYRNAQRTGAFTVSYPRPTSLVMTSLTAAPRCDNAKPILKVTDTFPALHVKGQLVSSGYLFLECEVTKIVDGFDVNSLVAGSVVAAYADPSALRRTDRDDAEILLDVPQIAYLYPGRFAVISKTEAFPFPAGMRL